MKAIVLAAGFGSRLGELTKNRPKCLVPAGGKPLLQHVMERLLGAQVNEVVINVYYHKQHIIDYVKRNNSFGITVHFSEEETLLGTGGGIRQAASFFSDTSSPFFIYNSDVFCDLNLTLMKEYHEEMNALVTLAINDRKTSRPLLFDENNRLAGWENTKEHTGQHFGNSAYIRPYGFAGVHIASPEILPYFDAHDPPFGVFSAYFDAVRDGRSLVGYDMGQTYWIDAGVPARLEELDKLLQPSHLLN